jgi:hypothetical protein
MMTRWRTKAFALGATLLCSLGSTGAGAQTPSPLAGDAADRAGYPHDVVVSEDYRTFAGGKALPVMGEAALLSRLNAKETAAQDLGLSLMPGLEVGQGQTIRLAKGVTAKLVTLRPMAYRGVPLAPGSDILSVANASGSLLTVRQRNVPKAVDGTQPTVNRDAAKRAAVTAGRTHRMPTNAMAADPALEVFVDASGKGRLSWHVRVASPSLATPWAREVWIAAIGQPAVLADREAIYHLHHGRATAMAWPESPLSTPTALGLPEDTVTRNGNANDTARTDADGNYAFTGGSGNATLAIGVRGTRAVVDNVAGAEVSASGSGTPATPVDLFINASGDEQLAQTSAFIWVNRSHALVADFLPSSALQNVPTNVNIAQNCNAFWNGSSLNFFHAGGGCVNTAYSDVAMHEYGHAVDQSFGGILDGGYSEGFGDAMSILGTRQFCLGRDFKGAGTCLRLATDVLTWPPDSSEVHQVGRRYAGFVAALVTELQAVLGGDAAFETARQLVLGAAAANPADIPDAVKLSYVVDDDDGDLGNGTPHCDQLTAAAESRHIPHPACPAKPAREHARTLADINGDGRLDIVAFGDAGIWTALANSDGSFAPEHFVLANFGADQGWDEATHLRTMADINGDGRADVVGFGFAGVWTALSTGDGGFAPEHFVLADFGTDHGWDASRHVRKLADINGDGRADIVAFGNQGVWTSLSTGDGGFTPNQFVLADLGSDQGWDPARHVRTTADINGDGRADIVAFGNQGVWTSLSTGDGGFTPNQLVLADFGSDQGWDTSRHVRTTADINGDGLADIVAFGNAGVWTALSAGNGGFAPHRFVLADLGSDQGWLNSRHVRTLADINGDGRADIVAFGNQGVWTSLSTGDGGFTPNQFVLADFGSDQAWDSLKNVRKVGDISGDHRADIVAFGDAGVWTALSNGDGAFQPHRFVLANFGTQQGWRGGNR